jgi:hypothetical protein
MTTDAREVSFESFSTLVETRHDTDWFEWCVFIGSPVETLNRIAFVEYTLHPTFPDPVRLCVERTNRFALLSAGWGGFGISITVSWIDGAATQHRYFLDLFKDRWPRPSDEPQLSGMEKAVYDSIRNGQTRWRKEATIARRVGLTSGALQSVLSSLSGANLIRRHYVKSIDGENLWGATTVVGVAPRQETQMPPTQ